MVSGLDTDAIVRELMTAQSAKKQKVVNKQTKLTWTQEIWKDLNTKLYSFYTGSLSKLKTQGSYKSKKVSSSNESVVKATATGNAATGAHSLKVKALASAQYITSGKINAGGSEATKDTKLVDLGMTEGTAITIKSGDKEEVLAIDADTTIEDFITSCKSAGLVASFDTKQQRFFIQSAKSGVENAFNITTGTSVRSGANQAIQSMITNASTDTTVTAELTSAYNSLKDLTADVYTALKGLNLTDPITDDELSDKGLTREQFDGYKLLTDHLDKTQLDTHMEAYIANEITAATPRPDGSSQLTALGLDEIVSTGKTSADNKTADVSTEMSIKWASDAEIELDGAILKDSSNAFTVNGLTMNLTSTTWNEQTGKYEEVQLNVSNDTDAVYKMVKDFVKEYNDILKELNEKYNAKSARGYDPLTDEQKEAMSDDQVEKWEKKIKDSLLRKDNIISSITSSMRQSMLTTTKVNGKNYSLASIGIKTSSDYTEKGLLHIAGDPDDDTYGTDDKNILKDMLEEDPDMVMEVLSNAANALYSEFGKKMEKTVLSSALTFYNDKQIEKQLDQYSKDVKNWDRKLQEMEDKYYKQFTAMEVAMSKLQSQSNYLSSLFGAGQ